MPRLQEAAIVETLKSRAAIGKVLDEMNAKEAHIKSLTVMIETMRKERQELQYQVRLLVLKLPMEVARERVRQKMLASKRAWWAKHKAEMDEMKKEKKKRAPKEN